MSWMHDFGQVTSPFCLSFFIWKMEKIVVLMLQGCREYQMIVYVIKCKTHHTLDTD